MQTDVLHANTALGVAGTLKHELGLPMTSTSTHWLGERGHRNEER